METLKYAGSVAGTLGISMKDLSVAIGLMAGAGVKASNSGTALRTLMSNLSAPTETVAGAMQKYGISLVTASDGSVDLDGTLRTLRESLKSLPLTEQAKACKDLAGKTGMTGLMAIVNATDAEYDKLSESIGNATETVSYFNENCASTGVTGEAATNKIRMLREAYEGSEASAAALNLTTQDLALVVQTLGSHADVTADNVSDLLNVFSKMKAPTEEQAQVMKKLGLTYHELKDTQFDYSKTCAAVDSSIIGLSQTQKEQIKSQLNTNMTMNEANKILKTYGLEAQSASTGQIDLIANIKELREKLGGMSEQARAAALEQLGLSSSIDEVNAVCNMSDNEFKLYCENLELAKGLTDKLAQAMDLTTKGTLKQLSSAIQDVAITAFLLLKDSILKVTTSLNEFFKTWRDADYSFEGFKKGLDGLLQSVKNMDLAGALGEAINGMTTFITGGGLSRILSIGSEIITKICDGIIQNKAKLDTGISSAIQQISAWVQANAPKIGEAGKVILEAISKGISDNKQSIHAALESVAGAMNSWISESNSIKSLTGNFADVFINSLVENITSKVTSKSAEIGSAVWSAFGESLSNPLNFLDTLSFGTFSTIKDWLFPKAYACGKETGSNIAKGTVTGVDENGNYIYDSGSNAGKQAGQGVVEGAEEGVAPLTTVMQLESATQALQQSATNMYNGAKVSFQLLAEVGKQSMTDMYLGMQGSMLAVENSIKASATNAYLGASQSYSSLRDSATNSMISLKNVVTTQSNEARNAAMTAFVSLGNVINTQVSQARNAVTAQFISIKSVVSTQSTEARNLATAQFISLNKVIVTQFTEARNNATTQMISLKKVAQTQATEMRDLVTTQMISMHKVIVTQITEARNGFTTQMMSMKKVAQTQSSEMLSIFRSCASQMNAIGVNIGSGLRNGLASQRGSIIATANSIANSVASTMRRALDIHSPSRVMKQIGVYTMEGYNVGMNAEYQQVKKDVDSNMKDIANRMKATVSIETSKVSANLSGNVSNTSTKQSDNNGVVGILEGIKNSIDSIDPRLIIDGKEFAIAITPDVSKELARRKW